MNFINWKWSSNIKEDYQKSPRLQQQTNNLELDPFCRTDLFIRAEINRREDIDEKMSERSMLAQCGTNPFLNNNNYVQDVVTRDMFLKPMNTSTAEKSNKSNSE
jgi:hypothetical protein